MNRGYLALAVALVLAAVLVLYVMSRTDGDTPMTSERTDPKITEADLGKPGSRIRPIAPNDPDRPTVSAGSGSATRDYMVGDVRVRDHRSGDHAPVDIPPAIHPPHGRRIPAQLTHDLVARLRGIVNECAASLPPEARGPKSKIDGEIMIAIRDHQATVTGATFQVRDVVGAADTSVKACLEQRAVGVATPSGDEADVESYAITLSLRLP